MVRVGGAAVYSSLRQGCFNHEWTLKASSTDYALKFFLMKRAGLRGRVVLQEETEVTERRGGEGRGWVYGFKGGLSQSVET